MTTPLRKVFRVGHNRYVPCVVVEAYRKEDFPRMLTRLGLKKMEFLIRGIAQPKPEDRVLELFSGTGLGTILIAQRLKRPELLVAVDTHNSFQFGSWRYATRDNYQALARYYGVKPEPMPMLLALDATNLPFPDNQFDMVIAADSPRSRSDDPRKTHGSECGMTNNEQRTLFTHAAREARRVLKKGGKFIATAPLSWTITMPFADIQTKKGPVPRLQFEDCRDPVRYIIAEK